MPGQNESAAATPGNDEAGTTGTERNAGANGRNQQNTETRDQTTEQGTNGNQSQRQTQNQQESSRNNQSRQNNNTTQRWKPLRDKLPTLSSKTEAMDKPDQFSTFIEKIQGHVGSTYDNPKDMDPVLTDPFTSPLSALVDDLPTTAKLLRKGHSQNVKHPCFT